jgi:hypothetical protein
MSMDVHVLLSTARFPSAAAWQSALDRLGTSVAFDDGFDPLQDSGFVPCKFENAPTGFEFLLSTRDDLLEAYPQLADRVREYDGCADFTWGGGLTECAAAISAAAALAVLAQGAIYDPQDDAWIAAAEAEDYARRTVAEIRSVL